MIFSPQNILDEVRETRISSSCCMGKKWAWVCYLGRYVTLLIRERESGLGILSGLELIHRPWDIRMAVAWVVWEYCWSHGKTKPFLEMQSWEMQSCIFSKCMRQIMLPGCRTFLLCSVFLCIFPSFLLFPFHYFTCGNWGIRVQVFIWCLAPIE